MTKIRIVDIKLRPWWKQILTTGDNIEAIIEDDRGNKKTVTVIDSQPILRGLLKEYIAKKYCTGNQFWKPPSKKKKKVKKPKISRKERQKQLLMKAMKVVGESFDCAIVLSEEADA